MPGSVSEACSNDSAAPIRIILTSSATLAAKPNTPYERNMNTMTATNAINPAILPAWIESAPRSGPTVLSSRILSGAGSAPARSTTARSLASATEKRPVIWPEPPRIGSRMTGALTTLPSSTIANGRLTLAWVVSPNRLAPAESKRNVTDGRPVSSNDGCASTKRSPLTITRLRTTYCSGSPAASTSSAESTNSEPAGILPLRASATDVFTSTRRNTIFAVRPSRRLMRSGSSIPGSCTRIRSAP